MATVRKRLVKALKKLVFGRMIRRADEVKRVGLHGFHFLDVDRDNLLTIEDIDKVLQEGSMTDEDAKTLLYMRRNIAAIGHLLRTERQEVTSVVPMGSLMVPVKESIMVPVYGIDKDDLRRYPMIVRFQFL